jgi:hydroxymethylpyrimidine pyrophosphatase-like HAD family hydrolase
VKYGHILNPLQNGTCIDIPHVTVNKTQGLLRVAEHFGVPCENVIAVGDNVNDTDMIRDFYSYAMERGVDSIKKLADATTETVAELIRNELEKQ